MQEATNNSGSSTAPADASTTELGISPSYATLFPEKLRGICSATAPESNEGPVAYLWDLYNQAIALEAERERYTSVPLSTRRPDLGALIIGPEATKIQPNLTGVLEILQNLAQQHVGKDTDLEKVLSTARHPLPLPFNHPLELSNEIFKLKKIPLMDVFEQSDLDYPSFTSAQLRTARMREAMLCTGVLEPERRSMLVEAFSTVKKNAKTDSDLKADVLDAIEDLTDVDTFIWLTGMEAEDVYDLLGVTNFNPRETSTISTPASRYILTDHASNKSAIMPYPYGAGFINQSLSSRVALKGSQDTWGTSLRFEGVTEKHLFRMNKILHLKRCLDIDYETVDLLILSAVNAEGQTADFDITENTIRALGVYRHLKDKFDVSAEQFAALIGPIPCRTHNHAHTLLDKLMGGDFDNDNARADVGIKLDGTSFNLDNDAIDAPTQLAYEGLCRALNVNAATLQALLTVVCQAQHLKQPVLSAGVLSALYRLTVLARILDTNTLEGLELLTELGRNNSQIIEQLAGTPQINGDLGVDILDILTSLASLTQWIRNEHLTASTLRYWLAEDTDSLMPVNALKKVIAEIGPKIASTLLNETRIKQELKNYSFAPVEEIKEWLPILSGVVDTDGFITNPKIDNAAQFSQKIILALKSASPISQTETINQTSAQTAEVLCSLVQNAHTAQTDITGRLAVYLPSLQSPLSSQYPELLIRWANEEAASYLKAISSEWQNLHASEGASASVSESLLKKWRKLCQLSDIVQRLDISVLGLKTLLEHPQWLSIKKDNLNISLRTLYDLISYRSIVSRARCHGVEEATLLNLLDRGNDTNAEKNEKILINDLSTIIALHPSAVKSTWRSIYQQSLTPNKPNFKDFFSTYASCPEVQAVAGDGYASQKVISAYYVWYEHEKIENYDPPAYRHDIPICNAFVEYIKKNPGPFNATNKESIICAPRSRFYYVWHYRPTPAPEIFFSETLLDDGTPIDKGKNVPHTVYDIKSIISVFSLQQRTGIPAASLLPSSSADKMADVLSRHASAAMGICDEHEKDSLTHRFQTLRRDALIAYLLSYWAPLNSSARAIGVVNKETLSSYLLTDVQVSPSVQGTRVSTATASLQYYLHRLFAYLEPGYGNKRAVAPTLEWNMFRKEYSLWRTRQRQLNHPENLIVPAARPGKTAAFKELENELSQSRLNAETVQSAVVNYLSKFEKISNLQFISGYLDGIDPSKDTYHFVGRTNLAPVQYFWRQLDMSMRDTKQRLSPLAWSEWEKIDVPVNGQITNVGIDELGKADREEGADTVNMDLIRPVIICGRRYVFWVENIDDPDLKKDENEKTKRNLLQVFYSFLQIDGQWSPANKVLTEKVYKRSEETPYLIVAEDSTEEKSSPHLIIMLGGVATEKNDAHQHLEVRDLLLMDKIILPTEKINILIKKLTTNLKEPSLIQRPLRDKATFVSPQTKGRLVLNGEITQSNGLASAPFEHPPLEALIKKLLTREGIDSCKLENYRDVLTFLISPDDANDKNYLRVKSTIFKDNETSINDAKRDFLDLLSIDLKDTRVPDYLWQKMDEDHRWPLNYYLDPLADENVVILNNAGERRLRRINDTGKGTDFESVRNDAPYEIELVSSYADSDGKTEIRASYPRILFDPQKSVVSDLNYTQTFTLKNKNYSITCDTSPLAAAKISDAPDLEWTITPALEADTKISYHYDNEYHPVLLKKQKNPSRHTAKLSINIKDLMEYKVSLIVHAPQPSSSSLYQLTPLFRTSILPKLKQDALKTISLALYARKPSSKQYEKVVDTSVLADGGAVLTHTYSFSEAGTYYFTLLETGNPNLNGYQAYDVTSNDFDALWATRILRNTNHVQYLKFDNASAIVNKVPFDRIRLNTLFGKELVAQASKSVDDVLQWRTQQTHEPAIKIKDAPAPLDFYGASGRYFREIFLHLPELVATRYSNEKRFKEAQEWCTRYLFDPFRTLPSLDGRPPYWNARPLVNVGSGASSLNVELDPAAQAFSSTRAHREAVFFLMIENWLKEGDHLYRQMTPDSLTQAWLCYQQAQNLIGVLPNVTTSSGWIALKLSKIQRSIFRSPPNEGLLNMYMTLARRFFTLRHGLTINGSVMPFVPQQHNDIAAASAARGVAGVISNLNSNRTSIPPYRFRVSLQRAKDAVAQLTNMGRTLMELMETQADTNLAALQLSHQVQLSDFTFQLQKEALNSAESGKQTLAISLEAAQYRKGFYTGLLNEYKSSWESAAIAFSGIASTLEFATTTVSMAEAGAKLIPNIFGMAVGGQDFSAPVGAILEGMKAASLGNTYIADRLFHEAEYARRAEDWELLIQEAHYETDLIKQQMAEQQILINAAKIGLEESKAITSTLKEAYTAMTTGFTILSTYNWMVARLSDLYSPAYDATLALCNAAEAAFRYEIGDYRRHRFIKPTAWDDAYLGMLAGEALQKDLLEMETEFTQRHQRGLSIKKTISLKECLNITDAARWLSHLKGLESNPLAFSLSVNDFDNDYPGHYMRKILHVSVSFVTEKPELFKNMCAILAQTSNSTLVEPDLAGVRLLYEPEKSTPVSSVVSNLRSQQQIALSTLVNDDGRGVSGENWLCTLVFDDGRYLPFEGTGAISTWTFSVPNARSARSLYSGSTALVSDIQINIVYTALDGGAQFASDVQNLKK